MKPTTLVAGILIFSVVPGLTPMRALRLRTVNAPNPANLTGWPLLKALVQVGIRDLSDEEFQLTQHDARIKSFFDWELNEARFLGKSWDDQCQEIINALTENVYISFDIDGLRPELCPNTGTPVPGGFSLDEVAYLLFKVVDSGKKIIGFDLNEVAPGPSGDWDANVGARALWELINAAELSRRQHAG